MARVEVILGRMDDAATTDDLARVLFAMQPGRRSTGQVTTQITRAVLTWALARNWSPRTEVRMTPLDRVDCERWGFVDVVVRRGDGLCDLAIEIDSTDKPWSVVKLRHAAELGMHPIWIRWGDVIWAGAYEGVDVIQLPQLRRVERRRSDGGQQPFW